MAPLADLPSQLVKDMDKHTPMHPLPEEIQKMPREETICKFCGVSYLILHEFKLLEEKIKAMEKELQFYQGSADREKQLQEDLRRLSQELEQNKTDSESRTKRLSATLLQLEKREDELQMLTNELKQYKEDVKASHSQQELLREKVAKQQSHLTKTSSLLRFLQSDQNQIKKYIKETFENFVAYNKEIYNQVQEMLKSYSSGRF
ncbi:hypothetical protein GDO86_010151 [Hymenochirus boettgeri]|uniref:Uncharacterized protein n=1 Tax=Hymenochirus boettgeri TaxID=247094 RepID=A0A8T2JRS6_9PIPI|nr:hypothetical protein GDO86_010151 [Hymenochirus boettgeri]